MPEIQGARISGVWQEVNHRSGDRQSPARPNGRPQRAQLACASSEDESAEALSKNKLFQLHPHRGVVAGLFPPAIVLVDAGGDQAVCRFG